VIEEYSPLNKMVFASYICYVTPVYEVAFVLEANADTTKLTGVHDNS
jgi:hypothetical protein